MTPVTQALAPAMDAIKETVASFALATGETVKNAAGAVADGVGTTFHSVLSFFAGMFGQ